MTATPDIIPSDLTLEIGESLSPDEFLTLTRAFFGYIKEVTTALAPEGERVAWTVQVKEGSSLIGVNPAASAPPEIVRSVYVKAANAARLLARGELEGADLPEAALKHMRAISDMSSNKNRPRDIRIWVERKPIKIDSSIGRLISEDWRTAYSDYGVVDGRLETIQDYGKLEILVRDPVIKQKVHCLFPETMLPKAFEFFRKRVEVSGLVHYRRNGVPTIIEVAKLDRLPDDSELPTAADVRGLLGASG